MREAKWYVRPIYAVVVLALILSIGITALPLVATVEANECSQNVWVDDTGPSCPGTGNGTQADPYCTIQDGVNHVCAGGTVHVLPGEYDGGITVGKANVTIQSTDGAEVTTVDFVGTWGFSVCNEGVTIDGFNITGFGGVLGASPESPGHNPEFGSSSSACGIHLYCSAHSCTIKNNTILRNGHGIKIETDNNQILYNNIRSNIAVPPSGIHIWMWASGNEIHCNNIEGNSPYGVFKEADSVDGVLGQNGQSVDATENYWGCTGGPGAAGCDPVSDNVLFNPYLRMPFQQCEECGGTPPCPPPMVPAVDQWGMVAMMSLFAGFLVWTVRRRRPAS
jgi:parallel beta-helix repeat protein